MKIAFFMVLFLFFPHFSFGKLKVKSGVLEAPRSQAKLGRGRLAEKNYIGTVQKVRGRKIFARLKSGARVVRKKSGVQVASTEGFTLGSLSSSAKVRSKHPVFVSIFDNKGLKRGMARLSGVEEKGTLILEFVRGQGPRAGWKLALEGMLDPKPDDDQEYSLGVGLFYELRWR